MYIKFKLKKILSYIYRIGFNINSKRKYKKNVIIFESFNGKKPSDNPLAIYQEYIKEYPEDKKFCYWSVKKEFFRETKNRYPDLQLLSRFSIRWMSIVPRANFWIFNSRMPIWLNKNKNTVYFQTWHGTPLKKLALDIENIEIGKQNSSEYKENFIEETKRWDYLISQNKYSSDIFRKAFDYKNKILEIGYPRNDIMIQKKSNPLELKKIKKEYFKNKTLVGRVILYAPTWRDDSYVSEGKYNFKLPFDLKYFLGLLDKNDCLIIRPHYLVKDSINIEGFQEKVIIDFDSDINTLYLISDLLITDYSSVMFDFSILDKPMLFYAYDFEHYKNKLRGFYFNYHELPGPIVTKEEDFYRKIEEFDRFGDFFDFQYKRKLFMKKFCTLDNRKSSRKVVEILNKK